MKEHLWWWADAPGGGWSTLSLPMGQSRYSVVRGLAAHALRFSGEARWVVAGQVAGLLGTLVLLRVVTDRLSPEEYGRLALALTLAGLVNQVSMGGIGTAVLRFYSIAVERNETVDFVRASTGLLLGATVIVLLGSLAVAVGMAALSWSEHLELLSAAVVFALVSGYSHSVHCVLTAARKRSVIALNTGLEAVVRVAAVVLAVSLFGATSAVTLYGYTVASALILGSQLVCARPLVSRGVLGQCSGEPFRWSRQMWMYCWPVMAAGLFNWGYFASQRWALEFFVSTAEVGRFFALSQVASAPVALAGSLLMTTIQPILFARMGDPSKSTDKDAVRNTLLAIVQVGLVGTLALVAVGAVLHDWLYRLLVSESYTELSPLLPAVLAATGLLQVSLVLGSYVTIVNKTRAVLAKDIVGNSAVAGINLFLTYAGGVHGLVVGMVLGALIHLIWTYRVVSRLS